MCAFFHRDGAGNWHPFSDAENALLERAHADGAPRCRLPTMGANPAGHRDFEVRFGANATSARMPAAPDTGMIQVNVENGNTRIVRRDDAPAAPDPFGAAIQLTQDFASSSAMYGWMLRKKLSGWRRGAWQRRFYVLAPRSGALLYFTKGLHTREVQLCRSADPAAPQAKGTILLRNAMILPETVDDDRAALATWHGVAGAMSFSSAGDRRGGATLPLGTPWRRPLRPCRRRGVRAASGAASAAYAAMPPAAPPSYAAAPPPPVAAAPDPSRACPRPTPTRAAARAGPRAAAESLRRAAGCRRAAAGRAAADAPPPDAPPQLPSPLPSKPPTEDIAESFGAVLQVSGGDAAGSAAEEHSECPVCFDELHSRPCGVLLGDGGRRLCTHIVHLDRLGPALGAARASRSARSAAARAAPSCRCRRSSPSRGAAADESALDDKWDEIWDHFDMDGTGTLSYDEFVDEERGLRVPRENAADLAKAVLAACDLDGSGQINKAEFLAPRVGLGTSSSRIWGSSRPAAAARRASGAASGAGAADAPANFDLTVRTNGGRAYSSRDLPPGTVTPDTTVGLLKDIVAQVHGETSVAHVKLINRGIALRDDAASLRDAGVREGDTLMLAPPYQQPQQPSYGQSSYGQSSYGQSSYGQPPPSPYGQQAPSYQQPQQPSYGQSSYGQPSYGQPPPSPYGQQAPSYQQPSSYGAYGQQSSPYGAAPPPAFAPAPAPAAPSPRAAADVPANAGPDPS
ncbi:hypothetical protein JL721_5610 [Aureococcus anophagefferens]|nr:hypothetical protein JL721_5610 [Aureococcus anophagefferens]